MSGFGKFSNACGVIESFGRMVRFRPMPSSVIRSFTYDPVSRGLVIEFVTGRVYLYSGVPQDEAEAFRAAFSKGRYFNAHIRDRYPAREL
jgi:hypothetical protein